MSGVIDTKQAPIYLVVVFATLGSYVVNSSDDVITLDAIESIKKDISDLENIVKTIQNEQQKHERIPAHVGQSESTRHFESALDDIKERVFRLESIR